jgi:hypothetical protein
LSPAQKWTGLEGSGILKEQSPKIPSTTSTGKDEDLYACRAKFSIMSSINEDIVIRRLKVANFRDVIRQKKAAVSSAIQGKMERSTDT